MANQRTRDHLRVDWFRVLRDCKRCGYSEVAVSREVSIPRTTLRQWCNADTPVQAKLEDGLRVIEFWLRVTGKPVDKLPWCNRFSPHHALEELTKRI